MVRVAHVHGADVTRIARALVIGALLAIAPGTVPVAIVVWLIRRARVRNGVVICLRSGAEISAIAARRRRPSAWF